MSESREQVIERFLGTRRIGRFEVRWYSASGHHPGQWRMFLDGDFAFSAATLAECERYERGLRDR